MRPDPTSRTMVALFLPSLMGGGAERVTLNLAEGLIQMGCSVQLVLAKAEGAYASQVPQGVAVVDLRSDHVRDSLLPLTRYLRRNRPDVLVSALGHANLVAMLAKGLARAKTRMVLTEHLSLASRPRSATDGLYRLLARVVYPRAAAVVAVSEGVADSLVGPLGLRRDNIRVIYNPVLTRSFWERLSQPPTHDWLRTGAPPVILGVGRLSAQKDFPTLLRAFAKVRQRMDARLIILGEGPDRPALEAIAEEEGIAAFVDLPGFVENPYAYMAAARVFVLSSVREGLPTVLIEALAAGTAIVSTDCESGPREILQGGRLGGLVPVADPEALAEAILRTIQSPKADVAREVLDEYSPSVAARKYLAAAGRADAIEATTA